jgi:hypothetical protein
MHTDAFNDVLMCIEYEVGWRALANIMVLAVELLLNKHEVLSSKGISSLLQDVVRLVPLLEWWTAVVCAHHRVHLLTTHLLYRQFHMEQPACNVSNLSAHMQGALKAI